jgi:hypothetical protein
MTRAFYGIAFGSLLVLAGSIVVSAQAAGGGAQQPAGFTNLQVWPADTPRAVILNFMNAFNRSLGIECSYCHVQRDGRFDFASDEMRTKRVARKMILFRDSINVELAAIVDKPVTAGPTCVHRATTGCRSPPRSARRSAKRRKPAASPRASRSSRNCARSSTAASNTTSPTTRWLASPTPHSMRSGRMMR